MHLMFNCPPPFKTFYDYDQSNINFYLADHKNKNPLTISNQIWTLADAWWVELFLDQNLEFLNTLLDT